MMAELAIQQNVLNLMISIGVVKVCTDVYDLKTGELVAKPNYINVEKYMK